MSSWRHEAFDRLPEFRTELQKSKSPYAYWIELQFAFEKAYRNGDIHVFERILEFADWCLNQPEGKTAADDLGTCVAVCFIEHLEAISPVTKLDRPRPSLGILNRKKAIFMDPEVKKLYFEIFARTSTPRTTSKSQASHP